VSRGGHRVGQAPRADAGYALLLAVFLAATMFVLATMAAPSIINQGRREREQQLIWRGNQYVRGIRLYFQKNGRFPQNKEELLKGTIGVHFVRKAFTDPVAQPGGDWRFIYVAPSGQLTGSVRYHTLQEMAAALGGGPNAGNLAALFGGPPAAPGAGAVGAAGAGRGGAATGAGRGAATGATAGAQGGAAAGQSGLEPAGTGPTPVPLQAVDGPVLGASLIGVASKVKQNSLLVYQGKDTYFEWEFIWNPLLNRGPGGAATPQAPGAVPAGAGPVAPGTGPGGIPSTGTLDNGAGQQQGPAPGQTPGSGIPGMPGIPMSR
jgi:hypothetical protein